MLTVTCQSITINPATIPSGTAGTPYTQTFTQTGGNGTVIFTRNGVLPAGMVFTPGTATLSGTPTQVGNFSIAIIASDANGCSGNRSYTLTINAPLLVWTGNTSADWAMAMDCLIAKPVDEARLAEYGVAGNRFEGRIVDQRAKIVLVRKTQ